jgi:MscS family membrane protein
LTLFLDACDKLAEEVGKDEFLDRSDPKFHQLGLTIISCLDTSKLPDASREQFDAEAAVCLKEILDRVPLPNAEEIPGIESVETVDGADSLTRWQVPRTQIVITKMVEGPRRGEFLFSSETVARAPEMYGKAKSQPYRKDGRQVSEGFYDWWLSRPGNPTVAKYVDQLPDWAQNRYFGMAVWQWVSLLILTPLTLAIIVFAFRISRGSAEPANARLLLWHWLGLVFPIIAILVPLGFKFVIYDYLSLRGNALYVVSFMADVVFLLGLMVLIVRVSSRIGETFVALPNVAPSGLDASLIRIICRVLGIAAAVVVLLEGGRYLGFPLTTLIASAGIGGLAIALSAQGLIKGLFGTVTVLLDKPYRVGERIIVKEHDGFVEEIGLRSTKIRALDNRLISIPNDMMSEAEIQNIGKHGQIRRIANLRIPLDTPLAQIEKALAGIREVLKDHEGMIPELPARVHFNDFNSDSFNIRVVYWFSPRDTGKFHDFSEKVNLEIMRTFEKQGIQFSLPFRHSYWKTDDHQGPLEVIVKSQDE